MKTAVVRFPGSNCDSDAFHVIADLLSEEAFYLRHDETDLRNADLVILPGGFAHGDYLRAGAMAKLSPIMKPIQAFARQGGLVLGICNGFQVLTEVGLLPGALTKNLNQQFICDWIHLRVENAKTPFTSNYKPGEVIRVPIAHGEGRYWIDEPGLKKLNENHQVVFRYSSPSGTLDDESNVNGSIDFIAGICNQERNVLGLMPHPERASELLLGGSDGFKLFQSIQSHRALARHGA